LLKIISTLDKHPSPERGKNCGHLQKGKDSKGQSAKRCIDIREIPVETVDRDLFAEKKDSWKKRIYDYEKAERVQAGK